MATLQWYVIAMELFFTGFSISDFFLFFIGCFDGSRQSDIRKSLLYIVTDLHEKKRFCTTYQLVGITTVVVQNLFFIWLLQK